MLAKGRHDCRVQPKFCLGLTIGVVNVTTRRRVEIAVPVSFRHNEDGDATKSRRD